MGGLSKKAYQMEELRKLHEVPFLTVDAGNLLFKHELIAPALLLQKKVTAEGIIAAYDIMQFDAVAVGRNDLAAGLTFLKEQAGRSKFSWLSANLVRKSDRKPVFRPSLIRELGDLKVGVIGLTGTSGKTPALENENAMLLDWKDVLPELAADLAARCDLVILLSNSPEKINRQIAGAVAGIHIIVQSTPRNNNFPPELVNSSIITQTGKQGKFLGWMLVDWQDSRKWGRRGAIKELAMKKQELDGVNGRISRIERREPKESLPANASYQNLLKSRKRLLTSINFLEEEMADLRKTGQAPSTYESNFITLELDLPDDPDVGKLVAATKQRINEANRTRSAAAVSKTPEKKIDIAALPFTGWQKCAGCHDRQAYFWESTSHSTAFQTLANQEQQFNLDCIGCHVTAEYKSTRIGENDSALLSLPSVLQKIGCEVCHGPGLRHAQSQSAADISRKPDVSVCARCHTPERDEEFNYAADLDKIACPADPK